MIEGRVVLPSSPRSAAAARQLVNDTLTGTSAQGCADLTALLTSELVTNATLHARTPVEVRVSVSGAVVRVDVSDGSTWLPVMFASPGDALSGRGLHIVQSLATRWGSDATGRGKTVWFELAVNS